MSQILEISNILAAYRNKYNRAPFEIEVSREYHDQLVTEINEELDKDTYIKEDMKSYFGIPLKITSQKGSKVLIK